MVTKHVHDPHCRQRHAGEVWTLGHDGSDQQSPVASPGYGELLVRRVALFHEVIARGKEVVEHVLFVQEHACLVPGLPKLPSAAQVGHGVDATTLQERHVAGAETWRQADVESAVRIEQCGVGAVLLEALLVDDEHWDTRAVFGGVPLLARLKLRRIKRHIGHAPQAGFPRGDVQFVNRRRLREGREGVVQVFGVHFASEASYRTHLGRQVHNPGIGAVEVAAHHAVGRIVQVNRPKLPSDHTHRLQEVLRLGQDVAPQRHVGRVRRIHRHQTVAGRIDVCQHVEFAVDMLHHRRVVRESVDDGRPLCAVLIQRLDVKAVAVGSCARVEHHVLSVLCGAGKVVTVGLVVVAKHQFVL